MSDTTYNPTAALQARLGDEINRISAAVKVASQQVRARLPERHFREIYLPMFGGDEKMLYPVDLNHWINFAGNPYREVDVIDENGAVIFTVPPVFDRGAINPVSDGRVPIAHVVQTAAQYARIHPHQGSMHLNSELTARALIMKVPANVLQDLETWNKIFARYGRPPIVKIEGSETAPTGSTVVKGSEDDFEFEPM